jgi:hypothetical protein
MLTPLTTSTECASLPPPRVRHTSANCTALLSWREMNRALAPNTPRRTQRAAAQIWWCACIEMQALKSMTYEGSRFA